MKLLILPILLLTAGSAFAEIIRLDCPNTDKNFAFFHHQWVLDIDAMKATLVGEQSPWMEPAEHRIYHVSDESIYIMKDKDRGVYWEIDRYTLAAMIVYKESGNAYYLSEKCRIIKKQF